ncbi:MAG: hypothetical protein JWO73_723 [Candidatus Taylorbacteria bacterium]|nr:hypothetical protein [Candidatus Taylorbacteria bacterium]
MSKRQVLMILGIWVMVFMFLGVTPFWLKIFAVITGAIIVGITVTLRQEVEIHHVPQQQKPTPVPSAVSENNPQ